MRDVYKRQTGVCPLCHCVVEQDGSEREAAYPDVGIREKRFALIIRIYVFLAVMASFLAAAAFLPVLGFILLPVAVAAVSYTHLDVYKRQVLRSSLL